MAGNYSEDLDDELEDELDSEEEQETDAAEESDDDQEVSAADERARKLQSDKDKETARANKAEKALAAMSAAAGDGATTGAVPPEMQLWLNAARSSARTRLYESDPRFKAFDIDPALIEGATPEEMEASFKGVVKTLNRMERSVRRAVMREHGIASPEPVVGERSGRQKGYDQMTSDEFNAVVERALSG